MKVAVSTLLAVFIGTCVRADQTVNGYYRNNGTYVQPYHRTNADGNTSNNYSTKGNYNTYTGQVGTHNPEAVKYGTEGYGPGYGNVGFRY